MIFCSYGELQFYEGSSFAPLSYLINIKNLFLFA